MGESREDERAPGAEPAEAAPVATRFVPPPDGVEARSRRGELVLTTTSWTKGAAVLQAGLLGAAITLALAPTQEPRLGLPLVALGVLGWIVARMLRSPHTARLSWDAWGLTLDEEGARTAIPWSSAHVSVEENGPTRTVAVHDQERAIVVAQGSSSSFSGAREAKDLGPLLAALEGVPRAPAPNVIELSRPALVAVGLAALPLVATALAVGWERPFVGVAIVLVGALTLGAAHDVARALGLAIALRGARAIRVEGAPGEPLRASVDDAAVTLQVERGIADARLGERGEPVRALIDAPIADAPGPYRDVARLRVRALETLGERKLRRMQLASGLVRGVIGVAAIAVAIAVVPAAPPQRLEPARPISTLGPPPPPPPARPIAPRPPSDRYEGEQAVRAWQASGPHLEHVYQCTGGIGCMRVPVFVDERTGTRVVCDAEHAAECLRLRRAAGLPHELVPE